MASSESTPQLTPVLNNKYRVDFIDQLGQGAHGTVYRSQNDLNETFAIKKISRKRNPGKAIEEARLLSKLQKRLGSNLNIVNIFEIDSWEESQYKQSLRSENEARSK